MAGVNSDRAAELTLVDSWPAPVSWPGSDVFLALEVGQQADCWPLGMVRVKAKEAFAVASRAVCHVVWWIAVGK
jgi:hypothetical protein